MAFFDDVVTATQKAGKKVGDKTKEIVNSTKQRMKLHDIEEKISNQYRSLGEYIYATSKTDANTAEEMQARIAVIDALKAEYEEQKVILAEAKNDVRCNVCGKFTEKEYDFCGFCGARLAK